MLDAGKRVSVLQSLAEDLGLPHQFCEADKAERATMGVHGKNWILASAEMNDQSEVEVQAALDEEFRRRETIWLQRIDVLNVWPILFVCGTEHVSSFSARLASNSVSVKLLETEWRG
ncbi:hypothetical protein HZ993_04485 [Rhodoferax sp. AJA081-3]|uniref:hypothetical protein n=1 Tax=Rhodoferax sp. AJA081-3 TaxID=2752316 RepID=UPI001ADF1EF6|nr:hypothetical protein [Rhodoferax sp. AJA081-3]QTN29107.1 hypothetical protein HZ993_04485 [Rhodoferax sp. AJA081-3]